MRLQRKSSRTKGFSLVEVVIAIGIVAILLTTFMAVFGPAQKNIAKALGVADVSRLTSTLENEMGYLRKGEESSYKGSDGNATAFEKAFQWVKDSDKEASAIVVYQYQGNPATTNPDGTTAAATLSGNTAVPGVDYITRTAARRVDNDLVKKELTPGVVVGSVYAVRMTQLVEDSSNNDGLKLGEAGKIVNDDKSAAVDSIAFTGSHLAFQAEFFLLPNNLSGFVTGGKWDFDKLGTPVVTQNIAVRR